MTSELRLTVETSLDAVAAAQWDSLVGDYPFMRHAFLSALHDTRCACPSTGWAPHTLLLWEGETLAGAMQLYLKSHSRGEYVFDYAWADAYARHGLAYYPKLLAAVPFTPVAGPRLLARDEAHRAALARGAIEIARRNGISSLHVLFPHEADLHALQQAGYLVRESVQFHWRNRDYQDFDDFLGRMNHDKRKKLRQDRKKVRQAGISFRWLRGGDISADDLAFFYRCYADTYRSHGNPPYLSQGFFAALHAAMPSNILIILAQRGDQPLAAALNIIGGDVMYGRYWGALEFVSGLHFETCYMQSIAYCLEQGLPRFEGGAQGEHKIARGLLPEPTWSAHWIADDRFSGVIKDFLDAETSAMDEYRDALQSHTPFKT